MATIPHYVQVIICFDKSNPKMLRCKLPDKQLTQHSVLQTKQYAIAFSF